MASVNMLTENEVADYLGITVRCVQKMRQTGSGPQYYKVSRKIVRYKLEDVMDWLETHKYQSTSTLKRFHVSENKKYKGRKTNEY